MILRSQYLPGAILIQRLLPLRIPRAKTSRGEIVFVLFRRGTDPLGRDPLGQNFRKFQYKIEWNRTFLGTHFENFGQPPEVVLFSGNLEIPGISCSIGHYHSVSSSTRPKRWRRQVFSPAIRMFLCFTRHRIILMTHFNVSDRRDDTFRTILGREVS